MNSKAKLVLGILRGQQAERKRIECASHRQLVSLLDGVEILGADSTDSGTRLLPKKGSLPVAVTTMENPALSLTGKHCLSYALLSTAGRGQLLDDPILTI